MVMSLDGFVTSPDGTHEWMFEWFGDDSGEWNRRALGEAGVHAMGRRSYEIMGPHWAASEGPIATAMNEKPKAVFSRTLEKADWGPAEIFGGDLRERSAPEAFFFDDVQLQVLSELGERAVPRADRNRDRR